MTRAQLSADMLDTPDKIVNVDLSEVKEAQDALEDGTAPTAGGNGKKKMQLKFAAKRDMSRFPRLDSFRIDKKAIVVRRIMQLQNKALYNNEVLQQLCDRYAVECDLSFEKYGQGKPATLEILAIQMILDEYGAPTMKMQLEAEESERQQKLQKGQDALVL